MVSLIRRFHCYQDFKKNFRALHKLHKVLSFLNRQLLRYNNTGQCVYRIAVNGSWAKPFIH